MNMKESGYASEPKYPCYMIDSVSKAEFLKTSADKNVNVEW